MRTRDDFPLCFNFFVVGIRNPYQVVIERSTEADLSDRQLSVGDEVDYRLGELSELPIGLGLLCECGLK